MINTITTLPSLIMKRRRQSDVNDAEDAIEEDNAANTQFQRAPNRTAALEKSTSGSALETSELTTLRVPETPSKRNRVGILNNPNRDGTASPSPRKRGLMMTPQKVRFAGGTHSPPPVVTNADRSARRKSVRRMVAKTLDGGGESDDDDDDELVGQIYSGSEDEEDEEEDESRSDGEIEQSAMRPKAKAGKTIRPPTAPKAKGRKKRDTTPPPSFFDGVDSYFHQNKNIRQQTSTATLSSLPQLDHSTYFSLLRDCTDNHEEVRARLLQKQTEDIPQWIFELSQSFNLLFYGYGSKRAVLNTIASALYTTPGSVAMVNGYVTSLTIKDILTTVASALLAQSGSCTQPKLGATPADMIDNLLSLLSEPAAPFVNLIIHNIDGEALRNERAQAIISRLAAHHKISLIASIDHIRAPLLWDAARREQFNFLWHDGTTFEPYSVEIPVDEALALVNGTGRTQGTKGVKYVLASLPSNAKSLFKVLISDQLQAMIEDAEAGGAARSAEEYGLEYKVLYQKAVSEFICSNDVAFRTLLKEYVCCEESGKHDANAGEGSWTIRWWRQRRTRRERNYYGHHSGRRILRRSWKDWYRGGIYKKNLSPRPNLGFLTPFYLHQNIVQAAPSSPNHSQKLFTNLCILIMAPSTVNFGLTSK